uniref:Chromosome 9 open reading frame 85 n=1 Tax=Leptobrachium leishanense TaxID=445787 RepID=A0A8C5PRV7_9ANUR
MSSQKGNVLRSRSQKHRNVTAFKNDKYDDSQRTKKINSKLHDGVCQRCKDVLEWRVKYSKFKPLSQPKKCVKCLQKTVKNAYHIICKPCAIQLELCAKCGKKEDIVLPSQSPSAITLVLYDFAVQHRSATANIPAVSIAFWG